MELQRALLLIGCIIVGVVALTTYERVRFSRRRLTADRGTAEPPAVMSRVRKAPPATGLDINPGPPHELNNRFLKSHGTVAPVTEITAEAAINEQLNDYEQTALMPLDLSLGLQDPDVLAAQGVNRQNMPDEKVDFVVTLPGKGPIGESELNTFTQLALKLADTLQRPTKFSLPFEEGLEKAQELDEFCETNEVLASIDIMANGPTGFSGRAIDQAARQFGLQFGLMDLYHKEQDQALGCRHLFSLANLYQPGEVDPAKVERFRTP